MSPIYWIVPKDLTRQFWLFRTDVQGQLVPFQQYEKYRCRSCGKIDELAALSEPLPAGLKIPSKWDIVGSGDDFIFVGPRVREVYEKEGMRGLDFRQLPGDPHYWLAMPTCLVETDAAKAGFEYFGSACSVCGRPRETAVGPLSVSLEVPSDPSMIFTSKMWSESVFGRKVLLFCQEPVLQALKRAKLKGVEYLKAL